MEAVGYTHTYFRVVSVKFNEERQFENDFICARIITS